MRSLHSLDRLDVTFDDEHVVADAGLMLPATLAEHLELREFIDATVDLGDAAGRANVGHKAMTLIHSALAGGDCIDDADALRASDTEAVLGHGVLAPSTLGTFLRSFTWGHTRQLDRVSGELPRPGRGPRARGRAPSRSRWISTRRSVRPTGSPSKAACSATQKCVAITRSSPRSPARATWCIVGCGAATPTPDVARRTS